MTDHDVRGWLEAVIVAAQDARWCTKPYCTTCGGLEFRRAFWTAAAHQAGVARARLNSAGDPRGLLESLSADEREATVRALVAGLRHLPPEWCSTDAFRTIILDLDPPLLRHGVPVDLATELSGSPAGEQLAHMEARERARHAERERRQTYESPQAVEERRRLKREEKARAHAIRLAQTRKRNEERREMLAVLASMSGAERLSRFATDSAVNLDSVPPELIPTQESEVANLGVAEAVALVARIGRRKGAWGRLRRMIEHRLKAESEERSSDG